MAKRDLWPRAEDCELEFSDFERAAHIEITQLESEWITEDEHRAEVEKAVAEWLKEEELLKGKVL